jgi:hypothetical protein
MATIPPLPPTPGPALSGPPWEQPGDFVQRFIGTVRELLTEPRRFFGSMRREGGLANPLIFAIIGMLVGAVANYVYSFALGGLGAGLPGMGDYSGMMSGGFASVIMLPIVGTLGLFIGAAIYHGLLSLMGGVRAGFEATFRVCAYVMGVAWLGQIIPLCGGIIAGIAAIAYSILGLQIVHDTTMGKAAAAVLIPVVVCCGLGLMFGAAMVAMLGMAAAAAN